MRELFETFDSVGMFIIAINGYQHYYGTTTDSVSNLCRQFEYSYYNVNCFE